MVFYGSTQDLLQFGLNRIVVGAIDNITIKTSAEFLTNSSLGDVVNLMMMNSLDVNAVNELILNTDSKHLNKEVILMENTKMSFEHVLEDTINSLALRL